MPEHYQVTRLLMETSVKTRSLRIKMIQKMKLLTTMDLLTNGKDTVILLRSDPDLMLEHSQVMRLPMEMLAKTKSSRIKTIQKTKSLTIMDSSINGKDTVILLKSDLEMTGTMTSVPMNTKKLETMLLHIELLKIYNHSGMRTTLCQEVTLPSQEMSSRS